MSKTVFTPQAPAAIGPYSQAVISGNLLFLSGQIPVNPETGIIEAQDIEKQTEQICRNIGEVLKAAGSDFEHVVKTTCFLSDMADFNAFNGVYSKFFVSRPARSCVAVRGLPKGALAEIEAVAEL